jgi:hypothetical protein
MTFDDLQFGPHPNEFMGGVRATHTFPNGYGVSVICGHGSYGGDEGLYELAVTHGGRITYDTLVTDDVVGHLTPERVTELLAQVEALPVEEPTP